METANGTAFDHHRERIHPLFVCARNDDSEAECEWPRGVGVPGATLGASGSENGQESGEEKRKRKKVRRALSIDPVSQPATEDSLEHANRVTSDRALVTQWRLVCGHSPFATEEHSKLKQLDRVLA
ncbi:hypothetical protein FI667_g10022, partial [Globisporangium splendens]